MSAAGLQLKPPRTTVNLSGLADRLVGNPLDIQTRLKL